MLYWVIGIVVVGVVLYWLDREVYFYEGTHMGSRIQAWLYDRWAAKYDSGKQESQARDTEMLAAPVLAAVNGIAAPLILDLATGTGRLPLALLREPGFEGHIVALDVSAGMLDQSAQKLESYTGRFTLVRQLDYPLPFPSDTFDVVCCLEALEVMPEMETPLRELFRVLRPGGLLLSSRATDASGRKGKVRSVAGFQALLAQVGFEQVEIIPWWRWFDRATARKPGQAARPGRQASTLPMRCPHCHTAGLALAPGGVRCAHCGRGVPQNARGVLLV